MRREFVGHTDRAERLKKVMRRACCLNAVISRTEYGLLIELSDGRACSVSHPGHRPKDDVMAAAVQWARRHGAVSVEIRD